MRSATEHMAPEQVVAAFDGSKEYIKRVLIVSPLPGLPLYLRA